MRKTIRPLGIMMCLVLFAAVHSWAGSLTVTNTFSANTQAVAADVNTNFDEVETAVNDNNTRIAAVESGKQTRVIGVCSAGYSIRVINEDGTVVCELDTDTNSGGDITAVYAGTGLSGGSTSGAATLSADTNYMQRRIGTGCSTGYAVRAVGSDGSVTCENIPQGDITGIYTYAPLTGGIASGYAYLDLATLYDTDIGDEPGVDWVSSGSGGTISTSSSTSNKAVVAISAPTSGYVIVTASGSVSWSPTSTTAYGMMRIKVSQTTNDVGETPGLIFFRQYFPTVGSAYLIPFSTSMVFSVAAGTNYFYLNLWHQVVNGSASLDDYSLIAQFVPTRY